MDRCFGDEIVRIGERRPDVVCVTAAMTNPVGLGPFARTFPDRVFDVGIAEQHAVCSAAGLAMGGLHPVVCLYATFLNRAFDQVLMDVALQRQPVTFVLDRAGITGPDGASHHGMWDTGILSVVPGLRVAAPRDPASLRELLDEAVADDGGPTVIRYPKATAGSDIPAIARVDGLDIVYSSGTTSPEVLLVAAGAMAGPCLAAAALLHGSGIETTVVDPRWITPISQALIELAARHRVVVTVEDAARSGGDGGTSRGGLRRRRRADARSVTRPPARLHRSRRARGPAGPARAHGGADRGRRGATARPALGRGG
ncbi:deoxyxylulose-5-phosphate synthase [Rhodococcus sp. PvR044]